MKGVKKEYLKCMELGKDMKKGDVEYNEELDE